MSLRLQHDWDLETPFWVQYTKPNLSKTVHGKIMVSGESIGNFTKEVNQKIKNSVCVCYTGVDPPLVTEFRNPIATYSSIHDRKLPNIHCVNLSSTGELCVSGSESGSLQIFETNSGTIRRTLKSHSMDVYEAKFFPSDKVVLSAGADFSVKLWDVTDGECAVNFAGHSRRVNCLEFVERGRNVLSGSEDGTIKLWNCSTCDCIRTFPEKQLSQMSIGVNQISLTSSQGPYISKINWAELDDRESGTDGKVLYAAKDDGFVDIWDLRAPQRVHQLDSYSKLSPFSEHLSCVGIVNSGFNCYAAIGKYIIIWDIRKSEQINQVWDPICTSNISSLHEDNLENSIWVATADGECFRIKDNKRTLSLSGSNYEPINDLSYSHNSHQLVTSARDGKIRLYRVD
ncbi:hypothetical protein M0812_14877 [Anaeramoeba flamelloides]|uniref:Uncharacterized protein n=1 Tax=Anaeramoeba flamelloides TaxID=1746091 RepID=A0AAV7ZDP8_9EUKA|nr:hypothetical protein M0812_14877 [Anaeramoeba flamelloides]